MNALILIILSIVILQPSMSTADSFDTPELHVLQFSKLGFPPQLDKAKIEKSIQFAADQLYENSYVDLGNMSDFMHMHALFKPIAKVSDRPKVPLTNIQNRPKWEELSLTALLIHTQEYSFLRDNNEYRTRSGKLLDPTSRNWIIWPPVEAKDNFAIEKSYRYSIRKIDPIPKTVRSTDLNPNIFGKNPGAWEYPFYFFRTPCSETQGLTADERRLSTLVDISLRGERVCLNLVSFYCRNRSNDHAHCGRGPSLTSYYSRAKK